MFQTARETTRCQQNWVTRFRYLPRLGTILMVKVNDEPTMTFMHCDRGLITTDHSLKKGEETFWNAPHQWKISPKHRIKILSSFLCCKNTQDFQWLFLRCGRRWGGGGPTDAGPHARGDQGCLQVVRRLRGGFHHCDEIPGKEVIKTTIFICELPSQIILKEIDEEFTEDELDEIIAEVPGVFR